MGARHALWGRSAASAVLGCALTTSALAEEVAAKGERGPAPSASSGLGFELGLRGGVAFPEVNDGSLPPGPLLGGVALLRPSWWSVGLTVNQAWLPWTAESFQYPATHETVTTGMVGLLFRAYVLDWQRLSAHAELGAGQTLFDSTLESGRCNFDHGMGLRAGAGVDYRLVRHVRLSAGAGYQRGSSGTSCSGAYVEGAPPDPPGSVASGVELTLGVTFSTVPDR